MVIKFMNNRIINILMDTFLLISYLSCFLGFILNLNKINPSDNILNIGKIISLSAILYLIFKLIKLFSLLGSPEEIQEKDKNFVIFLLIFISYLFNTYLYEMILNFVLFFLFEIVLVLLLLIPGLYYFYTNSKNQRNSDTNKIQFDFISTEKIYFTPYLDYLYFQYNYRRNIGFIKLYIFFGILIIGILCFYSNYQTHLFLFIIYFLQYLIIWLIVIFIGILPLLIYMTLKERRNDFKDLFEAYNSKDLHLLQQIYEKFNFRLDLSYRKEKTKVILSYFKATILANTGMYSETLELLNFYIDLTLKSMAFQYEFFNLMGQVYAMINEKDKAKEMILRSISGFKKLKFFAPIPCLELYLKSI